MTEAEGGTSVLFLTVTCSCFRIYTLVLNQLLS